MPGARPGIGQVPIRGRAEIRRRCLFIQRRLPTLQPGNVQPLASGGDLLLQSYCLGTHIVHILRISIANFGGVP